VEKPFHRLPFDALPATPRVPHVYARTRARETVIDSAPFGRVRVHWRECGGADAPPLLLLHGLMTTSYSWRYVIEPLASRFRVIAPDMPGCGASDKPLDRRYDVRSLAVWAGELLSALGARGCRAVGNSLGGYILMRLALDDPGAMSSLVDIHSPAMPELRYSLAQLLAIRPLESLVVRLVRKDPTRWAHRHVHYYDESLKSLEEARAFGEPLATDEGARAFVRYLSQAVAARGFRELVRDLAARTRAGQSFPIPLTLVYARQDPMVRPSNGTRLHALVPGSRLVWLERSSHFAQVDSPDLLLATLHQAFEEQPCP
jgi:pimeloyl-ACP methyl ester carboxylesterase